MGAAAALALALALAARPPARFCGRCGSPAVPRRLRGPPGWVASAHG